MSKGTIKGLQIEGNETVFDFEANNETKVNQIISDLNNISSTIDTQIQPKLDAVKVGDSFVEQAVINNTIGGCQYIPQDIENGQLLADYKFWIRTAQGVKLTGLCSANWDRVGLTEDDETYATLHIGADNYDKITIDDLTSKGNGTALSNWKYDGKKKMLDYDGDGYLFVIDQGAGEGSDNGVRFKIEFPDNFDCDYFTITGIPQNSGSTDLKPCNPKLLQCDDENAQFAGNVYSTYTYTLLGKHRKVYYLNCNSTKKIWATIKFYKFNDPTKYPAWVDNEDELDDPTAVSTEIDYTVMKNYTVKVCEVEELSGLCLNKDGDALIGISDSQGLWNIAFNGATTDLFSKDKGMLITTKGDTDKESEVAPDCEGIAMDNETGDLYMCVEYSGTGRNDIIKVAAPNYNKVEFVAQDILSWDYTQSESSATIKAVTSNSGFEGIAIYKKTADDMIFIVGNQNSPVDALFYSTKQKKVIDVVNLPFTSEVADFYYNGDYFWVMNSITGDAMRCFIDEDEDGKHTITLDEKFRMIFTSGSNENPESLCVDKDNKVLWIGTEIGKRIYSFDMPVDNVKTLTKENGEDVKVDDKTTSFIISKGRYSVSGCEADDDFDIKWIDGEETKTEAIKNVFALKKNSTATITTNGLYNIAYVEIEAYGAGSTNVDVSKLTVDKTKFTTSATSTVFGMQDVTGESDTVKVVKPTSTVLTITPKTNVSEKSVQITNSADKKIVITRVTIYTDDYMEHRTVIAEGTAVINRIDIKGACDGTPFIELYNASEDTVKISGAVLKYNDETLYKFTTATVNSIPAKSQLRINVKSGLDLSGTNIITFVDEAENIVDSFNCADSDKQSILPDSDTKILERTVLGAGTWDKVNLKANKLTLVDEITNAKSTAKGDDDKDKNVAWAVSEKGIQLKVLTTNWDRTDITSETALTLNEITGTYTWEDANKNTVTNWCKTVKCDKTTGTTDVKLSEDASHYVVLNDQKDVNAGKQPLKLIVPKNVNFDYVCIEGYGHKGNAERCALAFDGTNLTLETQEDGDVKVASLNPQWSIVSGNSVYTCWFKRFTELSSTSDTTIYVSTGANYDINADNSPSPTEELAKTKMWVNIKFYKK